MARNPALAWKYIAQIEQTCRGAHPNPGHEILARWDEEYRRKPWEAFGAHYLQMLGAMGGAECRARGEPLSAYENARGTGNIHVWFDPQPQADAPAAAATGNASAAA